MDAAKAALLFGAAVPTWADLDDAEDRGRLLAESLELDAAFPADPLRLGLWEAVASQIANDDPPQVWATARRLVHVGLDRRWVPAPCAPGPERHVFSSVTRTRTIAEWPTTPGAPVRCICRTAQRTR